MRRPASTVASLQRWFQAAVMHPDGASSARAVERRIEPSRELTARERLDVYAGSYFLRLRDVLKVDFPGVHHALGEDGFERGAREYVTKRPSKTFTLNDLGAPFPRFLAKEARTRDVASRRAFLAELAALERAVEVVFHEKQVPAVDVARLESIPLERWQDARFVLNPATRLFAFEFPVDRYLQDVLDGKSPRIPARQRSWVLVYRHDWRSWRARLSAAQFAILTALARGRTLGSALAKSPIREDQLRELGIWFREWTAEGVFTAIELPVPGPTRGRSDRSRRATPA